MAGSIIPLPPDLSARTIEESAPGLYSYWYRSDINTIVGAASSSADSSRYFVAQENISADKDYTPPFTGRSMIIYPSKALVVRLNSAANNPIALAAHIGLSFDRQVITKVLLTAVPVNTDIDLVITG